MAWIVQFSARAAKQAGNLPEKVRLTFKALVKDLQTHGPFLPRWPHFGKLAGQGDCYHCHLHRGQPTYVAVWKVQDRKLKVLEIRYVGTHEGASYRRLC